MICISDCDTVVGTPLVQRCLFLPSHQHACWPAAMLLHLLQAP